MATKQAAKNKANKTEVVIPAKGTGHKKKEFTLEEWDEMDNLATIPHHPPHQRNVYEGSGKQRKLTGTEDYYFRHEGLVYQADEDNTPVIQRFHIYEPVIKG